MATLFLVATPIGNLSDLSARAAEVLGSVDRVLAEDTRRTRILLDHVGVRVPVTSLHAHNEAARTAQVLERLGRGEELALVSDAGTPLVSDPGARLVREVTAAGHRVVPIPGPSAVLAALVASGLPADRFAFLGFAPRKGEERAALLDRVALSRETAVLFESPERLVRLLEELADACGTDRPAAVARELTKVHEEVFRGTLGEALAYYQESPPRGEVTVVVAAATDPSGPDAADEGAARALARSLLDEGRRASDVAREVARRLGLPRNRAYEIVHTLPSEDDQ